MKLKALENYAAIRNTRELLDALEAGAKELDAAGHTYLAGLWRDRMSSCSDEQTSQEAIILVLLAAELEAELQEPTGM